MTTSYAADIRISTVIEQRCVCPFSHVPEILSVATNSSVFSSNAYTSRTFPSLRSGRWSRNCVDITGNESDDSITLIASFLSSFYERFLFMPLVQWCSMETQESQLENKEGLERGIVPRGMIFRNLG